MKDVLEKANKDLLCQVEIIQEMLGSAQVARELTSYMGQVLQLCTSIQHALKRNLRDLDYNIPDTFIDILDSTQRINLLFGLLNSRLVSPIIRHKPQDRIGLSILQWLHDSHEKISKISFAISDGAFAIYPTPEIPPVYLLPLSRQQTLLYLPLLFHEVGHLFYICHKSELDDLVKEFQSVVSDHFAPVTVRDRVTLSDSNFRTTVVWNWYEWTQEIYCDALGFTIGGPCFLKAFSHYFCTRSVDQFYVPRNEQLLRRHPVTQLREKMLVDRAKKFGLNDLANQVDSMWQETANTLGISEDYEGTWAEEFFVPLRKTIDDMVEESGPPQFSSGDISSVHSHQSPVKLPNSAWIKFEEDPSSYRVWEKTAIEDYLRAL